MRALPCAPEVHRDQPAAHPPPRPPARTPGARRTRPGIRRRIARAGLRQRHGLRPGRHRPRGDLPHLRRRHPRHPQGPDAGALDHPRDQPARGRGGCAAPGEGALRRRAGAVDAAAPGRGVRGDPGDRLRGKPGGRGARRAAEGRQATPRVRRAGSRAARAARCTRRPGGRARGGQRHGRRRDAQVRRRQGDRRAWMDQRAEGGHPQGSARTAGAHRGHPARDRRAAARDRPARRRHPHAAHGGGEDRGAGAGTA